MSRNFSALLCVSLFFCSLPLRPAAGQAVSLTPSSLSFGGQGVGTTSTAKTVRLKNTSTSKTLAITSTAVSGEFAGPTTCGSSVAPLATCSFTVTFSPGTVGSVDGAITIVDNASPATQVASLTGKGVAPVVFAPTSLTFPATAIGSTSSPMNVTLSNSPTALTMGKVTASGDYAISANACTGTIAASKTCAISVTFSPTVSGPIPGVLTINDGAAGNPQIVALTGTGTVNNLVSFSPASLAFASQPTGTTSGSKGVTLTNSGTTSLTITSVSASGDYGETDTCAGQSIKAGKTCTITVKFTPTSIGTIAGALTVVDAAATSPQTVAVTGTGVSALSLAPTALSFTGQVGVVGTAQNATLANNSNSAIAISNVAISGDYSQTNTCAGSVAQNSSCTFSVSFVPVVGGAIDGALTVTTSGGTQVLSLSGSASSAPVARYAYALEYSAYTPGLVVAYSMNPTVGSLRALETVQLPSNNYGIVVHPSNKFLYLPDGSQILAYQVGTNGLLQPVSGSPFGLPGGSAMKFSPDGQFAYTNTGVEYSVNLTTGALTELGTATVGNLPFDVTLAPSGNFLYIPNFNDGTISGFTVSKTTGALTAMAGSPFAGGDIGPTAAVVSPNGTYLFVANASANNAGSNSVFSINSTTGALAAVAGSPLPGLGPATGWRSIPRAISCMWPARGSTLIRSPRAAAL